MILETQSVKGQGNEASFQDIFDFFLYICSLSRVHGIEFLSDKFFPKVSFDLMNNYSGVNTKNFFIDVCKYVMELLEYGRVSFDLFWRSSFPYINMFYDIGFHWDVDC